MSELYAALVSRSQNVIPPQKDGIDFRKNRHTRGAIISEIKCPLFLIRRLLNYLAGSRSRSQTTKPPQRLCFCLRRSIQVGRR